MGVLMQLFVDVFVALLPLSALEEGLYYPHIWTMWVPTLRTFIVTFFYDAMLQITTILWNPFDVEHNSLHLDPVLVATERATFWNMSLSCGEQLPSSLQKAWQE